MIEGLNPYPEYKESGLPWFDSVPNHWNMTPNRALMREQRSTVGDRSSNYTLLSLTLRGVVPRDMENPKGKFPAQFNTYKIVRPNDFVFCLFDIDETPRGVGLAHDEGMITGAYDVFSPTPLINPRFLYHYYLYVDQGKRMKPFYTGLRKTIQRGVFASLKAPLPPPDEQAAIVRFLDHANRKIDTFIRAKRKLIGLLNEQKQTIIHRAVTRGLNPDAPLKPSVVDWLGDIPKHWEVRRTKYLVREVDCRSKEGKETHLAMSQRLGLIPSDGVRSSLRSESYAGGKLCEVDDLVLNRLKAHLGVFAVATQSGVISPDYSVFRKLCPLNISYFESVLKSSACRRELKIRAKGIVEGFWRLYTDDFYDIRLPVPPMDEQDAIIAAIRASTAELNAAVSRTEDEIGLMQEYRTRLTADIVTGKLDVREAAKSLPAVTDGPAIGALPVDLEDELQDDPEMEETTI